MKQVAKETETININLNLKLKPLTSSANLARNLYWKPQSGK